MGACDEGSRVTRPSARLSENFAIKNELLTNKNNDVRVKVEMPEPIEASGEVKGELREDYQRQLLNNDSNHYSDRKSGYIPNTIGPCQPYQQAYRPVGLHNSFGFSHFYGHHHPTMMPVSFPTGRPDGTIDKIGDTHEHTAHVDRHANAYRIPISNDGFLHDHPHRFDTGDFTNTGIPYAGFRPSMRLLYGNHHNNNTYNRSSHYHPARQRKWSNSAFRGLHPPVPVSFFSSLLLFYIKYSKLSFI